MQLEYAKEPRWANAEQSLIDLTIKWQGIAEELPFTASPTDTEAHGRAIFAAALSGDFGPVADYVAHPEPEPLPPQVPQSVTMRQCRLALLRAGLLDDVDAAIAAIPDPVQRTAAQIEWEYAQTVDRNSPFTQQMAAGLNLTAEQLDALFTQAAGL